MPHPIPTFHSLPSPQALLTHVLPSYGLGDFTVCKLWYPGVNDTFLAETAAGERYILRVYRTPWRSLEEIRFELDALNHLHRRGVAVARPLPRTDGNFTCPLLTPEGTRYATLFTFADGREPDYAQDTAEKSYRYGQAVARIHQATEDFASQHARSPLDVDFFFRQSIQPARAFLKHRPEDWAFLQETCARFHLRMSQFPPEALDRGLVHADLQGYHTHIDADGKMTFFDFDCCALGYRAYDLAVFRWCARLQEAESARWEPFLRGYLETRPLGELDIQAIPWLVAGRYLWHIWLHTFNADYWGHGWLNDEYFDSAIKNLKAVQTDYSI